MTSTRKLWLCYGGMMSLAAASNLTPVYMTTFSETFGGPTGLTEEQLGRIPAVIFGAFVIAILITGPLADRWGARKFVLGGLLLIIAGFASLACAVNYNMLLLSVGILGFGAGFLDMVLSPIVAALRPDRRASAMNWLHSYFCTGSFVTVMIASACLRLGLSWRWTSCIMILLPGVVFLGFLPTSLPPLVHEDHNREPVRQLLGRKHLWAALALIFLAGGTEMSMAQWLPAYAERVLGFTKTIGAQALAWFSVGMAGGRILMAFVVHRFSPLRLLMLGALSSMVLLLIGVLAPEPWVALAACSCIGFSGSWLWPTTLAMTADRCPHGGASMFALLSALGNAGCVVMPWTVGFTANATSLHYGMASILACPTAMTVLLICMALRLRKGAG